MRLRAHIASAVFFAAACAVDTPAEVATADVPAEPNGDSGRADLGSDVSTWDVTPDVESDAPAGDVASDSEPEVPPVQDVVPDADAPDGDADADTADVCIPQCRGLECGDDGCGGECGPCRDGFDCAEGRCVESTAGDLDCPAVVECINRSGGAPTAVAACIESGTAAAQDEITELLTCMQDNCSHPGMSDEEFAACQEALCGDEMDACFE